MDRLWLADERFPALPKWLATAADAVLLDLQGNDPIELLLGWDPAAGMFWASEPGVEGETGWGLLDSHRGESLRFELAHFFQDQIFPESYAAWGQARPPCPEHQHPLEAGWDFETQEAWWLCPNDRRQVRRIGR